MKTTNVPSSLLRERYLKPLPRIRVRAWLWLRSVMPFRCREFLVRQVIPSCTRSESTGSVWHPVSCRLNMRSYRGQATEVAWWLRERAPFLKSTPRQAFHRRVRGPEFRVPQALADDLTISDSRSAILPRKPAESPLIIDPVPSAFVEYPLPKIRNLDRLTRIGSPFEHVEHRTYGRIPYYRTRYHDGTAG